MILSAIVATAKNGVIGVNNRLPWQLPAESAYFRSTIKGHPVITGRRNYDSMKGPMPGSLNIVVTHQTDFKVPEPHIIVHSIDEALERPEVKQANEVFILGGQTIYEQAMPKTDRLYLTVVDAEPEGDTFFRYNPDEWREIKSEHHPADAENKYAFDIKLLERKR